MIELTAAERLRIHLMLHYPHVKMKDLRLSEVPGFLEAYPSGRIDIRGASYGSGSSSLRLWNELHSHFCQHVQVLKRRYSTPTLIEWNGMIYHLDQTRSFIQPVKQFPVTKRRNKPQRSARIEKEVNRNA